MTAKILVVDDDPDIRLAASAALVSQGYRVEEAEDGQVALRKLNRTRFDLVIVDLLMPNVSGYEVLQRLSRETVERTPFVILTSEDEDKDILKGYSMGAAYYLPKPFRKDRLLNIVQYLIGDLRPEEREELESRL